MLGNVGYSDQVNKIIATIAHINSSCLRQFKQCKVSLLAWNKARIDLRCTSIDFAVNNKLTPFISMQNHYNLLYREEEREMMPLLKVDSLQIELFDIDRNAPNRLLELGQSHGHR